ncbi:hypothetical protein C1752_03913 [Acaryochloris thomasi RCC1774]|uniref:Uncharacterized protein n=1 Tax=Acaryochloris thomasi RCC1774 TaxID=1764569 RepID=A0A2W1JFW4_9CYAN|nr:tetratricopeptide repeat protein [Acaryochloris thomasi]PZD72326.1 hypothetical protein C1752_03913 [Acaryochloris thomasi RCC1774]
MAYQQALIDYSQAIEIDPSSVVAYHNRARIQATLRRRQAALDDYQQAAILYQKQGQTEEYSEMIRQIRWLRQSLGNKPEPKLQESDSPKPSPEDPLQPLVSPVESPDVL